MPFHKILCPVDLSETSAAALRYARSLAAATGAGMTVAYVNWFAPPPYFTQNRVEEFTRQFRDSFREIESALAEFIAATLGAGSATPVPIAIAEGLPADGIRRLAGEHAADLIIMGTHGRSGVNRILLGSVAERVLRESSVPVITVRGDGKPVSPPESILCAVNNTDASREALKTAAALAAHLGVELAAVHVKEHREEANIASLCEWIPAEVRQTCAVREVVREGDPAAAIVQLAAERPGSLLVIGTGRRRFFEGTILGSTAARVVRHAPGAVLTAVAPGQE
jgi:nucleotide-binding universal stress UspA family protein